MEWAVGDRVIVNLPNNKNPWLQVRRGSAVPVSGTVKALDEPGVVRGVRVQFDAEFNGVMDCYATHEELVAANESAQHDAVSAAPRA